MSEADEKQIRIYNTPRRLEKAMHMLEGILRGMTMDRRLCDQELLVLDGWISEHREFRNKHPFSEVLPRMEQVLEDRIVDEEERADLLWLCDQFVTGSQYFDSVTADLQRLHGIMAGIAADSRITVTELRALSDWMDDHEHLIGCWPFDEVAGLITGVLADGRIDADEHDTLLHFFADVLAFLNHRTVSRPDPMLPAFRGGICAVQPNICVEQRRFCFTGKPKRGPKRLLQEAVEQRAGIVEKSVIKQLDYLIVGAAGNECWAYSAYGRKVEAAIHNRRNGAKTLIVHETDFWDAIEGG